MPDAMYRHEHPEHYEQAKAETQDYVRRELEQLRERRQGEEEEEQEELELEADRYKDDEDEAEAGEDQSKV
jgi:hypothetical protein